MKPLAYITYILPRWVPPSGSQCVSPETGTMTYSCRQRRRGEACGTHRALSTALVSKLGPWRTCVLTQAQQERLAQVVQLPRHNGSVEYRWFLRETGLVVCTPRTEQLCEATCSYEQQAVAPLNLNQLRSWPCEILV